MEDFGTLPQPLLGELVMSWRERGEKNALYSGHLRFCLQRKCSARTPLGPMITISGPAFFCGLQGVSGWEGVLPAIYS